MRKIPVIFSFNYITHETVPEVNAAFKKVGFEVYEASSVNADGSYIGSEQLIKRIENAIRSASEAFEVDPWDRVAVIVHFDDYVVFDDERVVKALGEDPFVIYVHADREARICAFENGAMTEWYRTTDSMEPGELVGCPISVHEGAGRRMHSIPAKFRYDANESLFSAHENWLCISSRNELYWLRSYLTTKNEQMSDLYELRLKDGCWHCVMCKQSEAGDRLLNGALGLLKNATGMSADVCFANALIGTNIFWFSDGRCRSKAAYRRNGEFVSLCASDEEMNNFLNSRLYRELTSDN